MIAKLVFDYLEPYLPYQVVYGISMITFFFEKLIMPKVKQVYSNVSLDPQTLLPFLISAVALYLSIVSIFHAFKAAFRMIWFMIKWSLVIILVWLVLAMVNDFRDRWEGGNRIGRGLFDDYQTSITSWWKTVNWNTMNLNYPRGFDPLQLILDHGYLTFFEPLFDHFQPQNQHTTSSFNPHNFFSSQNDHHRNKFESTKSKTRSSNDQKIPLPKLLYNFWVQSVQAPIQFIINQSKSQRSQAHSDSGTYNR